MKIPYTVLKVSESADDEEIKKAYLEAVRNNPPDLKPEQFREIRRAYEMIATRKDRLRYELFDTSIPDIEEIAELIFDQSKGDTITEKRFRSILDKAVGQKQVELE